MIATSGRVLLEPGNPDLPARSFSARDLDHAQPGRGNRVAGPSDSRFGRNASSGQNAGNKIWHRRLIKGRSSPRATSDRCLLFRRSHHGIFGDISTRRKNARNRLHLFGSDCGGIGEGCGAASCNRGCEENCFLRHSLSFRLEIWTRENLRPQPTSVADRAQRCRVRRDNASPARTEGALNREIHSRAMKDPSPSARLWMTIRMA